MTGQMTWRLPGTQNQEPHLHLRNSPLDPWVPYEEFIGRVPDGDWMSAGYPTFCKFVKLGWEIIKY